MNIVLYTNILTPYRKYFYDKLYQACKNNGDNFNVLLMAETEPDRSWRYSELKSEYTVLLESKTITISKAYIHFNKNLKKTLKALKPDIIVCAGGYLCPGIWQVLKWKSKLGCKCFYWSESHLNEERGYGGLKLMLRELIRKKIYSRFDGFWYAGSLSKEFIQKYAKEDAEYFFMPNLVDANVYSQACRITAAEKLSIKIALGLSDDKRILICPARLTKLKGIDKLFGIIDKSGAKEMLTLLIAGEGEQEQNLRQSAYDMRLDVKFLGFQNQEQMVRLYGISDIFVLPSLSDPNPLSCIEALWAGLPLFISEHCGNYPEVVKENENGFVFSYLDESSAAERLCILLQLDDENIRRYGDVSKNIAAECYDVNRVIDNLMNSFHRKDI